MHSAMVSSDMYGITNPSKPSIFPPIPGPICTALPSLPIPTDCPNQALYFSPNSNSTSDEVDGNQFIDDRKQRRMKSNRESARRSRMRKKRRVDELRSQAVLLRTENCNLLDKLNHLSETHRRILQENVRLKEEACDLRRKATSLQDSHCAAIFREFEEITYDLDQLRA